MYFEEKMFNPLYVNPAYYNQVRVHAAQYQAQQNIEVVKAAKAMRDVCASVKRMDDQHQREAFLACLSIVAQEFGW